MTPNVLPEIRCHYITHTLYYLLSFFQVVVKFIRRDKVLKDCWVDDKVLGPVPLEISLLGRLNHPNIVKVSQIWSWKSTLQDLKLNKRNGFEECVSQT